VVIDSETESDNEIYWPVEDDRDENFFEDKEQKSLLLIDRNSEPTSVPVDPVIECENPNDRISEALEILQNSFYVDAPNRQFERILKTTTKSDFMRLICVFRYLKAMQKKQPLIKSSEEMANCLYPEMNKERTGRNIRIWAQYFLENHRLPEIHQGRNINNCR
jgi:hypothetical protein